MGKKKKAPILFYPEWSDIFLGLSRDEAGMLIQAIFSDVNGKSCEDVSSTINAIRTFMVAKILEDQEKYENKCIQMKANINKRYQMNTNVDNCKPLNTNADESKHLNTNEYKSSVILNSNLNSNLNLNSKDKEKIQKESSKRTSFARPTLAQISEYVNSLGYEMDSEAFFNFYESNGWKVGKNSMKDWKAAVRSWESREKNFSKPAQNQSDIIAEILGESKQEQEMKSAGSDEEFDVLKLFGGAE